MSRHPSPLGSNSQPLSPPVPAQNNHSSLHWRPENHSDPSRPGNLPHSQSIGHHPDRSNTPSYSFQPAQSSTTPLAPYVYQPPPPPQPSSQYYHHPQSNASAPWTPAPTTSDVHNRNSRSNSVSSSVSSSPSVLQCEPAFTRSEMLSRYLTVNPDESSLVHEAHRAIQEGRVREGENMLIRRCKEQGWKILDQNEYDDQGESDGSRTLGRSRDGRVE